VRRFGLRTLFSLSVHFPSTCTPDPPTKRGRQRRCEKGNPPGEGGPGPQEMIEDAAPVTGKDRR